MGATLDACGDEALRDRVRHLEAALATAEESLIDALHVTLSWAWETDADLRLTRITGRLDEILGARTPTAAVGRRLDEFFADRDDPAVQTHFATMRRREPYRDMTFRMRTPNGLRWVKASAKPLVDRNGNFRGYRGMCRDVTSEVAATERAEAIHRRFAEAIDQVPVSLTLYDADDRLVICNSATRGEFYQFVHLLEPGTPFRDLTYAMAAHGGIVDAEGQVDAWVEERMRLHRAADRDMIRHYDDGRWVRVSERRTSDGGTIITRVDITALKRSEEEEAQRAREAAEHAKELERSNSELEQFAYVASHDLQEPLRMVASYCQLLQRRYKGKLDEDADEFIGYAVEGASRMQRLINDLLAYSRVGRKGNAQAPMSSEEAVQLALANLQGAIADSGVTIEVDALPTVIGDRTLLAQLFQNLVGNAIKFRRDEAPTVRITATQTDGAWQFTVADNGIGIEAEYLDRVFLIFQRLHERSKYPGTGIGLAIAKKVVDYHGGRIWIDSTPGQGSRFHFTLPPVTSTEPS
jgi:PAS domain S-box-containing protein